MTDGPGRAGLVVPDAALALGLAVVLVPVAGLLLGTPAASGTPVSGTRITLLSLAILAPLALRRAFPVLSAVLVYGIALAQLGAGVLWMPADAAVLIALYSVTLHGPRRAHVVALAAAVLGGLVSATALTLTRASSSGVTDAVLWVFLAVMMVSAACAAWAIGRARRLRRETIDALRDRAERLERERDQQAAIGAAGERARIAREMHDVVAHSLSVIIAQADGGRYASTSDPQAGVRALEVIAETGRAALADMRAILGVLRNGSSTPQAAQDLTPQPAATDLEALVQQTREAGVAVSLVKVGTPRTLPAGVGLTLYRICQEALTNVLKHAGPAPSVTVLLRWADDAVQLEVTDDGRGASAVGDGGGHGLLGMRERAAMFGGTVSAGPRPGGGFQVQVLLPTPRVARAVAS